MIVFLLAEVSLPYKEQGMGERKERTGGKRKVRVGTMTHKKYKITFHKFW